MNGDFVGQFPGKNSYDKGSTVSLKSRVLRIIVVASCFTCRASESIDVDSLAMVFEVGLVGVAVEFVSSGVVVVAE